MRSSRTLESRCVALLLIPDPVGATPLAEQPAASAASKENAADRRTNENLENNE
jgi:hypothetical protein